MVIGVFHLVTLGSNPALATSQGGSNDIAQA